MPAGLSSDRSAARAALLSAFRRLPAVAAQLFFVLAVVALVGLGLLPRTGWYRPVTVLSGSMRPAFSPGDMVVVTRNIDDLQITFSATSASYTAIDNLALNAAVPIISGTT